MYTNKIRFVFNHIGNVMVQYTKIVKSTIINLSLNCTIQATMNAAERIGQGVILNNVTVYALKNVESRFINTDSMINCIQIGDICVRYIGFISINVRTIVINNHQYKRHWKLLCYDGSLWCNSSLSHTQCMQYQCMQCN